MLSLFQWRLHACLAVDSQFTAKLRLEGYRWFNPPYIRHGQYSIRTSRKFVIRTRRLGCLTTEMAWSKKPNLTTIARISVHQNLPAIAISGPQVLHEASASGSSVTTLDDTNVIFWSRNRLSVPQGLDRPTYSMPSTFNFASRKVSWGQYTAYNALLFCNAARQ